MTADDIAALSILLGDTPEGDYDGRCKFCYANDPHTSEEHDASVAAYLSTEKTLHEAAAGAKCHEEPDGFCLTCGVEMTVCNVCHGIGYHREGCSAETVEMNG